MQVAESSVCISGLILQGLKKPHQCPAFGKACTPQTPLGATMVSSEGACAAYYHLWPLSAKHVGRAASRGGRPCLSLGQDRAESRSSSSPALCLPWIVEHVLLGHGSGGTLTADLIQQVFMEGLRFQPATGSGRPGDTHAEQPYQQRAQGHADRADDRFVRGPSAVLPRWRYWPLGGPRHGQRPGGGRGHARVPGGRIHPGGRAAPGRSASDRGFHARGLRRGGRLDRHRRHQGGRPRQGRPDLHYHHGRGHRPRGAFPFRPQCPARATRSWSRARSAIMASPSCRSAKGSNSKRCWKAIRRRCTT